MIQLGEKLGGKYFVTEAIDASRVGHFVEVRDAQGTIYHAQPLLSRALPKEDLDQLKAEVDAVPRSMAFFKPDAVVWSKSGVPVAVYPALPPTPLLSRLAALFTGGLEERRRSALRALLGMFAPLAEELNNLHAVGVVHGAITLARLHVVEDRGVERLSLSGFGVEAAERYASKKPRPQPKADFAALTLCLADAMDRVKARPEGAPLVRWEMLRNCARAGDHPALQSGVALATAMRGVLDEPWRRTPLKGTPAVGEPIRASISSPGVPAVSAPPGAPTVSAPAPAPAPTATTTGGFVAPPRSLPRPRADARPCWAVWWSRSSWAAPRRSTCSATGAPRAARSPGPSRCAPCPGARAKTPRRRPRRSSRAPRRASRPCASAARRPRWRPSRSRARRSRRRSARRGGAPGGARPRRWPSTSPSWGRRSPARAASRATRRGATWGRQRSRWPRSTAR
ncbi:MAG: hypothetical protein R3A52_16325 [Polyangiales bacterium]